MSCSFNHCIDNCCCERNRREKKKFKSNASINFIFKSVSIRKMLCVSLSSLPCIGCLKDVHCSTSTALHIYVANESAKAFHFSFIRNWIWFEGKLKSFFCSFARNSVSCHSPRVSFCYYSTAQLICVCMRVTMFR